MTSYRLHAIPSLFGGHHTVFDAHTRLKQQRKMRKIAQTEQLPIQLMTCCLDLQKICVNFRLLAVAKGFIYIIILTDIKSKIKF